MVLALAVPALATPVPFPTNNLLPPTGQYVGPATPVIQYTNGVQGRNPVLSGFSASWPPPVGGTDTHSFTANIGIEYSVTGGVSWVSGTAPVNMTTAITDLGSGSYSLEVLAMDVNLGGGALIRESPVQHSLGSATITGGGGGGGYMIDSFFDVFTELSLDNGQNWVPSTSAEHFVLTPEPASLALLGLGALVISRRRR